jgi:hypothetical protein
VDETVLPCRAVENFAQQERLLSFASWGEESDAKLRSLSWWREFRLQYTKHQPKRMNVVADIPATAGIIFRNFLSGKRRINKEVK